MPVKYLAICFQVFAYEEQLSHCEPQMNAVCESCFLRKNSGKFLVGYLRSVRIDKSEPFSRRIWRSDGSVFDLLVFNLKS